MRLSKNSIKFVKERRINGMTYGFSVSCGNSVSDCRDYSVYMGRRTVALPFDFLDLPKSVRSFIDCTPSEILISEEYAGDVYEVIIYRSKISG